MGLFLFVGLVDYSFWIGLFSVELCGSLCGGIFSVSGVLFGGLNVIVCDVVVFYFGVVLFG